MTEFYEVTSQVALIHGALDGAGIAKQDDDGKRYSSFGRVTVALAELAALRKRVGALEGELGTIAHQFKTSEEIINTPFDEIGLEPTEHLEMAYDNMQAVAVAALTEGGE